MIEAAVWHGPNPAALLLAAATVAAAEHTAFSDAGCCTAQGARAPHHSPPHAWNLAPMCSLDSCQAKCSGSQACVAINFQPGSGATCCKLFGVGLTEQLSTSWTWCEDESWTQPIDTDAIDGGGGGDFSGQTCGQGWRIRVISTFRHRKTRILGPPGKRDENATKTRRKRDENATKTRSRRRS